MLHRIKVLWLLPTISLLVACFHVNAESSAMIEVRILNEQLEISALEKKLPTSEASADGEISLLITGGSENYKVQCFGPNLKKIITISGNEFHLDHLTKGDYLLVIQDGNGHSGHFKFSL